VSEGPRARAWILVVPTGECARLTLANHDLSAFTNAHGTPGGAHHGHVKPRHRPADRAERPAEIDRGDARALRHAVAFADLDTEPRLERPPNVARASAAPGDAHPMLAIDGCGRLLEQHLQNAAQIVNMRRPHGTRIDPETAGGKSLGHG